jgi:hypothetical protein
VDRLIPRRVQEWTLPYAPLARKVLPLAALATLIAIGLQFVFAGIGVFGASILGITGFDAHKILGGVIHALLGLLLAAAIVGRQPRAAIVINAILFVVASVMMALPLATNADLKALHPVGALIVFWLTYVVYQRSLAVQRAAATEAAEAAPVPVTP